MNRFASVYTLALLPLTFVGCGSRSTTTDTDQGNELNNGTDSAETGATASTDGDSTDEEESSSGSSESSASAEGAPQTASPTQSGAASGGTTGSGSPGGSGSSGGSADATPDPALEQNDGQEPNPASTETSPDETAIEDVTAGTEGMQPDEMMPDEMMPGEMMPDEMASTDVMQPDPMGALDAGAPDEEMMDPSTCEPVSVVGTASSSRGMGFTGTDDDYSSLYYVLCDTVDDCAVACAEVGGSEAMCAASECTDNFDGMKDCLPATAWRRVNGASSESGSTIEAAELTVVYQEYSDFLAVEGFGFSVPDDAVIEGIEVEFLRAAGSPDLVTDHEIVLLRDGERSGMPLALEPAWGTELEWVKYGSATNLWGEDWTPRDVNATGFGAAISTDYLATAGNARAYVDHARITVHYRVACDAPTR